MINKKKIVLVTYGNFPFGGASANLLRLFAKGLIFHDTSIEVILPTGMSYGNNNIYTNNKRTDNFEGINYRYLGYINHPKSTIGKVCDRVLGIILPIFYLIIKRIKGEVNTVIIYNSSFSTVLSFAITKLILFVKVIFILPEFYEKPKGKIIPLLKWYDFYFGINFSSIIGNKFIVLTHYLKQFLLKKGVVERSIYIMPNLVDKEIFNLGEVKPYMSDKITIGYVGSPTIKDGINDLMNSFAMIKSVYINTHLLIIGDITNGNTIIPKLKNIAFNLNILENISFTGLITFDRIPFLLNQCQVLALTRPSGITAEAGFPTKLGEYFACRKPIILTEVGDLKKYFTNRIEVILVKPNDIESISNGISELLENQHLGKIVAENGYKWMIENLEYKSSISRILNFI